MSIALAYLFYFVAASASPLQRRALAVKKRGTGQIQFAFFVSLIIAAAAFVLVIFYPVYFAGPVSLIALLSFVCAVVGAAFLIAQYTAQHHIDAGITTLVSNIYTPVTIIIATLFLDESLTTKQILGTLLLLASIVLISKKHHLGRFRFDRYFILMLSSGVMLGILLSAERALMKTTGVATGTLISWWSQAIGLGIAAWLTKSRTNYTAKEVLQTGGLRSLQALSWIILIAIVGNLSVVSAVTTFKVVVIFIAAAIFLKEREDLPRKIVGSFIAVAGLLLMK